VEADPILTLLGTTDRPAFEISNPDGRSSFLLVCDHASNTIPHSLGTLGLTEEELKLHIAIDIGAGDVARKLSQRFDAPAVLAGYSRLVVDVNRRLNDTTAIPDESDNILIPANIGIDAQQREARIRECYMPYHTAISTQLGVFQSRGEVPAVIAIHSFAPVLSEQQRPWDIGILWDKDSRLSRPLINSLSADFGFYVGDNQPYSGKHPADFTIDHHAESAGYPHAGIEIRHDLITHAEGVDDIAQRLGDCLEIVLADPTLYHVLDHREREPGIEAGLNK
jgi:predicted N-formylglutamate amidohydrolase